MHFSVLALDREVGVFALSRIRCVQHRLPTAVGKSGADNKCEGLNCPVVLAWVTCKGSPLLHQRAVGVGVELKALHPDVSFQG